MRRATSKDAASAGDSITKGQSMVCESSADVRYNVCLSNGTQPVANLNKESVEHFSLPAPPDAPAKKGIRISYDSLLG